MSGCKLTMVLCAYGENPFLKEAAASLAGQTVPVNVIVATSTPSEYVESVAREHGFAYRINPERGKGIGPDWEFAAGCAETEYVTIAHQDDIYFPEYAENILKSFEKYPDSLMVFTNSCDRVKDKFLKDRGYLKIKRLLLWPYYLKKSWKLKLIKAAAYSFGNAICCPSVTYNTRLTGPLKFDSSFASNLDWMKWRELANMRGRFTYVRDILMAHRIDETTATSSLIQDNRRYEEDLRMFTLIWGKSIAAFLMKFYSKSYKMAETE